MIWKRTEYKSILKEHDMKEMIEYLKRMIIHCHELGGMEKEKWAFQQSLKKARKLL